MLYDFHEFQRTFLNPLAYFTEQGSRLFSHPYSPLAYTPVSRQIAASYSLVHRLGKEYEKPQWGLTSTTINGETVAVHDEAVLEKPFCKLVHFKRDVPDSVKDPVVLIVAPLSGHYATLLRDTVKALLPNHNIYITDWVDARMVPLREGPFHLNDYIVYVQEFLEFLGTDTHVVSVCQPTVPVLAAVSLMADDHSPFLPKTMTLMGGPIDTRESPTQVNDLAIKKSYRWFADNLIHRVPARFPGFGRKVYPGFLQHCGFIAMNPDRHAQSHYDYYLNLIKGDNSDAEAHQRFYDEYNAVLDLPAEFYLDTIDVVFQRQLLPNGEWEVNGRRVDPSKINNVALFTIEGEYDDISGLGQTRAAHRLCANIPEDRKQHYTAPECGHYGIFSGRRWRETIAPQLAAFFRKHA